MESAVASSRARNLAVVVSYVASPPVSALAVMILAGELAGGGLRWIGAYCGLAIALPLTYLLLLRHRGEVSDLEVVERVQRLRPYAFATLASVLAASILLVGHAPVWIARLAVGIAANTLVVWLITHRWKISFHCSSLSYLGAAFWLTLSQPTFVIAAVALMNWARVSLRRHSVAQTLAGTALGIALAFAVTR